MKKILAGLAIGLFMILLSGNAGADPGLPGGDAVPIPEPATMLLFGTGLVGLAGYRLIGKKKK